MTVASLGAVRSINGSSAFERGSEKMKVRARMASAETSNFRIVSRMSKAPRAYRP
jgi:hypothetical protein